MPESLIWSTDPHLDHAAPPVRERFLEAMRETAGQAVILTGDTSTAARLVADLEAIGDAAARPVHHVLGNHDHYGSSIAAVRDAVVALAERRPEIRWLPPAGVVALGSDTALIGVDGWADGRHGDPLETPLRLNDDRLIGELAAQPGRAGKLAVKRLLADADAARLRILLDRAAPTAQRIVVATHVPPFVESLPARGPIARPEWWPLLVCGATGQVLRDFAATHPDHQITVLAGHTHAATDVAIMANLRCLVGAARYGAPSVVSFTP
jgi:predicted phosphohydrolase